MASYRFVTEFGVGAPIDRVYASIVAPEAWLGGWSDAVSVRRVRVGAADGVGAVFDATVRAPVGYQLTARIETVEARPPTHARMQATGGVDGSGEWQLRERDGDTEVAFVWDVRTTEAWMNALAPVARPLFEWSHGVVMQHAVEAAADHLGADLTDFRSRPAPGRP